MARGNRTQRVAQIRAAYQMTRKADPKVGWILLGCLLGTFAVFLVVGLLIHQAIFLGVLGVLTGIMVATFVFGRRAEGAAYSQVEGQPGAAAAVLDTLRRGWTVTPAVAVNRQQDLVHRAVGRPGVVLVGEGSSRSRVTQLLANERKKMSRVVPDVPVHEVLAGNGEGEVPLRRLTRHVMKLPATLGKADVAEVNKRLKAVGSLNLPMPKGPMPKGMRMPKMPKGGMR
jgi:hypothetical protein